MKLYNEKKYWEALSMASLSGTTTTGTNLSGRIGSVFQDWLKIEGIQDEVNKEAKKRVAEWETCARIRFARDNPNVTTICISCSCSRCTVTCF